MKRSTALKAIAAGVFAPYLPAFAADDEGPIRLIVGYGAGGATDLNARVIAQRLGTELKRDVIVENRPGGNTLIANRALAAAAPDGRTFLIGPMSSTLFREIMYSREKRGYSMLTDYVPVASLTTYPMGVMVSRSIGVRTGPELVQWLKANPQQASFGTSSLGSHTHLLAELFSQVAGFKLQAIPYPSNNHSVTALMGNQLPAAVVTATEMSAHLNNNKVVSIGTFTEQRSRLTPTIPTFAEQGIKAFGGEAWMGMWAPAKTPQATLDKVNKALAKIMAAPDFVEELRTKLAVVPMYKDTAGMKALQDAEIKMWTSTIKASGFTPES